MHRKLFGILMLAACLTFGTGITVMAHPAGGYSAEWGCHENVSGHCHGRRHHGYRHNTDTCPYCDGQYSQACPYRS